MDIRFWCVSLGSYACVLGVWTKSELANPIYEKKRFVMKFLLVSAFAENGKESGANRLRKLRMGIQLLKHECDWMGPTWGFHS